MIVFLFSSNINSAIEPIEELSFSIPGLTNAVEQFAFNDIDNDNIPEVLATDGSILVLYSIAKDSILFTDTIPARTDTLEIVINYRILFDDINRDSIPDILYARYFSDSEYFGLYPIKAHCEIIFFDGSNYNNSQIIDLDPLVSDQTTVGSDGWQGNLYLKSIDINGDYYNELVISFKTIDSYFDYLYTYSYVNTDGINILYNSFPDSLTSINSKLLSNVQYLPNDNTRLIANTYFTSWFEGLGIPSVTNTDNHPAIFNSGMNTTKELIFNRIVSVDCSPIVGRYETNSSTYTCMGDIDSSFSNKNILIKNNWYRGVTCYASPMIEVDTSGSELTLQNFIAPDSLRSEERRVGKECRSRWSPYQ